MQKTAKLIATGALVGELNAAEGSYKSGHHLGERFAFDHDPYVTYHPVKKVVHKAVPVIKHHQPVYHAPEPLYHAPEPLYHAPLVIAPEPVYKVVHRPLRYVARPARVYKRPSYKHVHHVHHHHAPAPVKVLDLEPKTHYVADFSILDGKCDAGCVDKKATQVLKSFEAEVEKEKETCLQAAEALRKQMVDEAAALRAAQVHDVAHQVDDSIKALEKLKAESIAMLRPILDQIEDEKHATIQRIKKTRQEIEKEIKHLKGHKVKVLKYAQV